MRELNVRDKKGNKKDSPPPPAPPCQPLLDPFSAAQKETMKQIFHFLGSDFSSLTLWTTSSFCLSSANAVTTAYAIFLWSLDVEIDETDEIDDSLATNYWPPWQDPPWQRQCNASNLFHVSHTIQVKQTAVSKLGLDIDNGRQKGLNKNKMLFINYFMIGNERSW